MSNETLNQKIKNIMSSLSYLYGADTKEEFIRQFRLRIEDDLIDLLFLTEALDNSNTVAVMKKVRRSKIEDILKDVDEVKKCLSDNIDKKELEEDE